MLRARWSLLLACLAPFACGDHERVSSRVEVSSSALTPSVGETESWDQNTFFQASYSASVAFDDARKELIVFGGDPTGTLSRTWTWNGAMRLRATPSAPSRREYPSMAYDSDRKRVVLFGGSAESGPSSETWAWDGQAWTKLAPTQSPPARYYSPMTYDRVRKVVLISSGFDNQATLRDTWAFDGQTWREETKPAAPIPFAYRSTMFFDENEGVPAAVLLDNGLQTCDRMGIWRYRGGSWLRESPAGIGPAVCISGASFDAVRKRILVFGAPYDGNIGTPRIWTFDGAWQEIPSSTPLAGRYFNSASTFGGGELVLVGGEAPTGSRINALQHWNGSSWQIDPTSRSPGWRTYPAVTTRDDGSVFLFGGLGDGAQRNTWLYDGTLWKEQPAGASPPARAHGLAAFDSKRGEVLLYGGLAPNGAAMRDTWIWDGTSWTELSPPTNPGDAGNGSSMVYDPVRDRVWLLDGWASGSPFAKLWSWDGQTRQWTLVPTSNGPRYSAYPAFGFDRTRNVAVLFGGNARDDTWTWDGATWTQLNPKNRPAGRQAASLAWDTRRERLVLFGGYIANSTPVNDVWTWDGQDWTSLVNAGTSMLPRERAFARFTPVGPAGNLLLLGGDGSQGSFSDQWTFRARGGACTTGAACGSGSCVDGVCCETAACGSCETCAGLDPGICSPVRNAEDPDTCTAKSGKRCNEKGTCVGSVSALCTQSTECASGFCVDGVCCSTACDLPCEACSAARKLLAADDGRCGAAKVGEDPGGRCGTGAACNANGSCETRTQASCRDDRTLDLGFGQVQDCAPYRCANGTCAKACKTYSDCASPATCNPDGRCEAPAPVALDAGGCSASRGRLGGAHGLMDAVVAGAILVGARWTRQKRRRGAGPRKNSA